METRIFRHHDAQYTNYRIPGMVMTRAGVLLAYCEARRASDDWARMDILLFRSTDGGCTFSPPVRLAEGTDVHPTVNNPVMAEGTDGTLHFLYCEDYGIRGGRVLHRVSHDAGISWSESADVTYATRPEWRNAFALGPGHGICTPDGTLLFPVWMVPRAAGAEESAHAPSVVSVLYSRDGGKTWRMGDVLPAPTDMPDPGETEAALREDGSVYFNCRLGWGVFCRGMAVSRSGTDAFADVRRVPELTDPCCFGSVVSGRGADGVFRMIYAGCRRTDDRKGVSVWVSTDGGETWRLSLTVDEARGGYVECALSPDGGTLFVLYEDKYGEADYLSVIRMDEFTGKQ